MITWLHLWLGLISGIIVFVVSITGCLFVFQKEVSDRVHRKEFFVDPPNGHSVLLPLDILKEKAQMALGADHPVNFITAYADPERAWEFMAYQSGDPDAITFAGSVKFYQSVFVNPYSGEITGRINYMHDFFVIVKYIHWSLLLNTQYGQPVVGWGTVIFVLLLITGFIMWIPKRWNKKGREQAFRIKWKAKWRRLNYDLHNVLGFYVFLIALILAFTGMVFAFRWFQTTVYVAASLSTVAPEQKSFHSDSTLTSGIAAPLNTALAKSRQLYPGAVRYGVDVPAAAADPVSITAYNGKEVYYDANTVFFDRLSGNTLGEERFKEQNNGEKLIRMNYDIHVGAIAGLPGKMIAFLISLICASLPVTGFLVWWGRRNKKKYSKPSYGKERESRISTPVLQN